MGARMHMEIKDVPSFMKYLDPTGDPLFWKEVEDRAQEGGQSGLKNSMLDVRAEWINQELNKRNENPILVMINDWYAEYQTYEDNIIDYNTFEREIAAIAKLIIRREYALTKDNLHLCRFSQHFLTCEATGILKTILHEIADSNKRVDGLGGNNKACHLEKNLVPIARCVVSHDPSLLYATTEGEELEKLPVELALANFDDAMASFLLEEMEEKHRVRMLFEHHYERDIAPRFKFIDFISRPDMPKTIKAILDSLMSPYTTLFSNTGGRDVLDSDMSINYRYHFRILDGDLSGRRPTLNESKSEVDDNFNWCQMSCLQALCTSSYSQICMKHAVVRLLARRKWDAFGRFHVRLHLALYLVFLFTMSFALIGSCYEESYRTRLGKLVLACEVISLCFSLVYFCLEVDQFCREKKYYFLDAFNYVDIFGICSFILTLVLRWSNQRQYAISACTFILNYVRIFKFLSAFRSCGIYLATISFLMKENLPVFFTVYSLVLVAVSGSCFIANQGAGRASSSLEFGDVVFRGLRIITEGQAFADDYKGFGMMTTYLILGGSMTSTLILANILIAQLSESYSKAKADAILRYDIAKLRFVSRIENGRFRATCLRLKHYKESLIASDEDL